MFVGRLAAVREYDLKIDSAFGRSASSG